MSPFGEKPRLNINFIPLVETLFPSVRPVSHQLDTKGQKQTDRKINNEKLNKQTAEMKWNKKEWWQKKKTLNMKAERRAAHKL